MIDGTIAICPRCGGEATIADHLVDAHSGEDGPHLVWQHNYCGHYDEVVVSKQTLKACVQHNDVILGKRADSDRELSEAEVELIEFVAELIHVKTPADFGWEVDCE